jgi:hypothetical protein
MTIYMLSVHNDPAEDVDSIPEEELKQIYDDVDAFNDVVKQAGKWVFAGGLKPIESSTTVDGRGESPVITDGPFSESKEYLGGFWIITAEDLDEALDWAARGSKACRGRVEVRPFEDDAG